MNIQTTAYETKSADVAKFFAAAAKLVKAGHFVSIVTSGSEVVLQTSATNFEFQIAYDAS